MNAKQNVERIIPRYVVLLKISGKGTILKAASEKNTLYIGKQR